MLKFSFALVLAMTLFTFGCEKDSLPMQSELKLAETSLDPPQGVQYDYYRIGVVGNNATMSIIDFTPHFTLTSDGEEVYRAYGSAGSGLLELYSQSGYSAWLSPGQLSLNGKQVIGLRQPSIPDATSPEDMVIKFNQFLKRLIKSIRIIIHS